MNQWNMSGMDKLERGEGFVYFVKAKGAGLIKVGHAAHVGARVANMQTGCPLELHVIASIPASRSTERWLHFPFPPRASSRRMVPRRR